MSSLDKLIERLQQLTRVMQIAVLAGIGTLLFLLWDSYLKPYGEQWSRRADAIERQVEEVRRTSEALTNDMRQLRPVITGIGPVRPPLPEREGSEQTNAVVNAILTKHGASNPSFSSRVRGRLPRGTLMTLTRGKRIDRLTVDVKFDATPAAAIAIIADLESDPHTESISNVRILRDTGGKVKVQMTVEAWVLASEAPAGAST